MTVENIKPSIEYTHDNPGSYSFSFKVFKSSDLVVSLIDGDGIEHVLAEGTDYLITLNTKTPGGYVNTSTALKGKLVIKRVLPFDQDVDWINNSAFDMEVLEAAMDKNVMLLQQLDATLDGYSITTNWRGDWVTGTFYNVRDVITAPDTSIYVCIHNHISNDFNADLNNGYWQLAANLADVYTARNEAVDAANQTAADRIVCEQSATTASGNAAQTVVDAATATDAAIKAEHWAIYPYNTPVPEGDGTQYSAFHYAQRAAEIITVPAYNTNLLINPEFTVNQLNYVNGSNIDGKYGHDMWIDWSYSGLGYSVNPDGSITLHGNGSVGTGLHQTNRNLLSRSRTVTVSVKSGQVTVFDWNGQAQVVTPSTPYTFTFDPTTSNANCPTGTNNGIAIQTVNNQDTTFYGLKVEEGPIATNFQNTVYEEEYNKCIAYLYKIACLKDGLFSDYGSITCVITTGVFTYIQSGGAGSIGSFHIRTPVDMVRVPNYYYDIISLSYGIYSSGIIDGGVETNTTYTEDIKMSGNIIYLGYVGPVSLYSRPVLYFNAAISDPNDPASLFLDARY